MIGLLMLVVICNGVHGDDMGRFVKDLVSEFKLLRPTILLDDELPEQCFTHHRMLCLSATSQPGEMSILAEHVRTLYNEGRQDGFIVVEGQNTEQLLTRIANLEPLMFSSNIPTFMPLYYSDMIRLRLDTNVLFYEKERGRIKMTDKYAVKDGPPIALDFGAWDSFGGLQLKAKKSRHDRRRDLMGATLNNGVFSMGFMSYFTRDDNGKVTGSEGFYPELLNTCLADSVNATVVTKELPPEMRWRMLQG